MNLLIIYLSLILTATNLYAQSDVTWEQSKCRSVQGSTASLHVELAEPSDDHEGCFLHLRSALAEGIEMLRFRPGTEVELESLASDGRKVCVATVIDPSHALRIDDTEVETYLRTQGLDESSSPNMIIKAYIGYLKKFKRQEIEAAVSLRCEHLGF